MKMARRLAQLCTAVLIVLITLLSLLPESDLPEGPGISRWLASLILGDPERADKVRHFLAYSGTAFVAVLGLARSAGSAVVVALTLLAYSGALEILQAMGGVRTGDWLDLLANASGCATGTLAAGASVLLLRSAMPARQGAL